VEARREAGPPVVAALGVEAPEEVEVPEEAAA
jgi:hypothetical protein